MKEFGRFEHDGHSFVAQGATVDGKHVTGYQHGESLTTWHGGTMLACRFFEFAEYRDPCDSGWDYQAVAWLLPHGRAIVGLTLGEGALFRGCLVTDVDGLDDLRREAEAEAEHWVNVDQDDWEREQIEKLCEVE